MKKAQVSLIKCRGYQKAKQAIADALGKIDSLKIFKNKKVLLKVNLNKAADPDKAVNTHPEFVRAVIQVIKAQGGLPFIGESSAILGFTKEAFKVSGIEEVAKEEIKSLAQNRIGVMPGCHFIIVFYYLLAAAGIFQNFSNCQDHLLGQKTVHYHQLEVLWLYIPDKHSVAIY